MEIARIKCITYGTEYSLHWEDQSNDWEDSKMKLQMKVLQPGSNRVDWYDLDSLPAHFLPPLNEMLLTIIPKAVSYEDIKKEFSRLSERYEASPKTYF